MISVSEPPPVSASLSVDDGSSAGAALVEPGEFDVGAEADLAGIGLQFAGQQLDQRGLAGAIGADDADAVAADDARREIVDDDALAEALADVLGLDHHLARDVGFGDRELDRRRPARFWSRRSWRRSCSALEAPDVALAPRA